jgi:hypothetical protein
MFIRSTAEMKQSFFPKMLRKHFKKALIPSRQVLGHGSHFDNLFRANKNGGNFLIPLMLFLCNVNRSIAFEKIEYFRRKSLKNI